MDRLPFPENAERDDLGQARSPDPARTIMTAMMMRPRRRCRILGNRWRGELFQEPFGFFIF